MSEQPAIPLFIERLRAIEAACAQAIDLLLKKRGRAEEFVHAREYESLLWIQSTCEHWRIIITYWHQESRGRNVPLRCTLEWMGEDLRLEMLRSARTVDPHRAERRAKIYVLHGIRQAWAEIVGAAGGPALLRKDQPMSKNDRAESTYQPQHPRCPLCERELWPLMDQERLPDGRLAHTYCLLRQKRNQPDGSGARKGEG